MDPLTEARQRVYDRLIEDHRHFNFEADDEAAADVLADEILDPLHKRIRDARVPSMDTKPAPGSQDARRQGCRCPQEENRNGEGVAHAHDESTAHFCVSQSCPIHGFKAE